MALFMALAAVWSVVTLAVISWPARSVRLATLLLMIPIAIYGCGTVVVGLQLLWTRGYAAISSEPLPRVIEATGYTAGPVIEELVKIAPLVLIVGLNIRSRLQWGLTDYVVAGGAIGAGFSLLEAILRFGASAERALPYPDGGWVLPSGFSSTYVPGLGQIITSWLPAPIGYLEIGLLAPTLPVDLHVVFTSVAALGVGIAFRARGPARLLGLLPVAVAIADHALYNYAFTHPGSGVRSFMDGVVYDARWVVPLLAVAIAIVLDARTVHRVKAAHPDVRTAAEQHGTSLAALARYSVLRLPFTALIALRYVRMRRATCYAFAATPAGIGREQVGPMVDATRLVTDQIDGSAHPAAWRGVTLAQARQAVRAAGESVAADQAEADEPRGRDGGRPAARPANRTKLLLLAIGIVVPLLLATPAVVFFGFGGFPSTARVQEAMLTPTGFAITLTCAGLATAFLAWRLITSVRFARAQRGHPVGEILATARLRVALAAGAIVAIAVLTTRALTGADPRAELLSRTFLLEAMLAALLGAGLAVGLLALLSTLGIGMGPALALAGGGVAVAPTALALSQIAAAAGMGALSGALLSVANQSGGTGTGRRVPDLPQRPPAQKPWAEHPKLRNIIDNIYKGINNPKRIGNGTTMDAARNELRTGRRTHDQNHVKKAMDEIAALDKWIHRNRGIASERDVATAQRLLDLLQNALRAKPPG